MDEFSLIQVFSCDERGLNFCLLPHVTLAASFKKSAVGRKKSKDLELLFAQLGVEMSSGDIVDWLGR